MIDNALLTDGERPDDRQRERGEPGDERDPDVPHGREVSQMSESDDEYMRLLRLNQRLTSAVAEVRAQMAALSPRRDGFAYRIALRPDIKTEDPFSHRTLLDDIVVNDVPVFRAEQMDRDTWWVACYLDNDTHDRICWSITARSKPLRIEWVTTEFPESATYEHLAGAVRPR